LWDTGFIRLSKSVGGEDEVLPMSARSSSGAALIALGVALCVQSVEARTISEIIAFSGVSPYGLAVDAAGNLYVTGPNSDNAFMITPDGVATEIIDRTGDGRGNELNEPRRIAVDAESNVYVTGRSSDNAFKITPEGVITQIIDSSGDGSGNRLRIAGRIAVDQGGNVYVLGYLSSNVFRITPDGVITQIMDGLTFAEGLALDAAGNAYVCGRDNAFKIALDGVTTRIVNRSAVDDGIGAPETLNRIAVDAAGNVYIAVTSSRAVKITPEGFITQIIDSRGDRQGNTLLNLEAIAVDAAGNVYVAGQNTHNVFQITPEGVITQIIDETGDGMGKHLFIAPEIAVDATGDVYVVGASSRNVFKISPSEPAPSPERVLEFFQNAVEQETIVGFGSGYAAGDRLSAFEDLLEGAVDAALRDNVNGSCWLLEIASARSDGAGHPADYVEGTDTSELLRLIGGASDELGCFRATQRPPPRRSLRMRTRQRKR